MQPIPFIDDTGTSLLSILVSDFGALLCFLTAAAAFLIAAKGGRVRFLVGFMALFTLGFATMMAGANLDHWGKPSYEAAIHGRTMETRSEIREHYGLKLTERQLQRLDYPDEKPKQNFEVFGSTPLRVQTDGRSSTKRTVYLVWNHGELQLSESKDGKHFSELSARD